MRDATQLAYTQTRIEIPHGHWGGGTYTAIFHADGTAEYHGEDLSSRNGDFEGTFYVWQFNRIAQFIVEIGFMDMPVNYSLDATDLATVYTYVKQNGRQKVIRNYGFAGPPRLWALEQLIRRLDLQTNWMPAD